MNRRTMLPVIAVAVLAAGCGGAQDTAPLKEIQRARAGDLAVVVLSAADTLKQGRDAFVIEFRNSTQTLVDVGDLKVSATMIMAGMPPMIGTTTVTRSATPGRYEITTELSMAGTWRLGLDWDGPAGAGSTTLQGQVQ